MNSEANLTTESPSGFALIIGSAAVFFVRVSLEVSSTLSLSITLLAA